MQPYYEEYTKFLAQGGTLLKNNYYVCQQRSMLPLGGSLINAQTPLFK